jgi:hypothetical protein
MQAYACDTGVHVDRLILHHLSMIMSSKQQYSAAGTAVVSRLTEAQTRLAGLPQLANSPQKLS